MLVKLNAVFEAVVPWTTLPLVAAPLIVAPAAVVAVRPVYAMVSAVEVPPLLISETVTADEPLAMIVWVAASALNCDSA